MDNRGKQERVLIVTGFSGAGISSALKALEDMGYEVFDNFPLSLIDPLLDAEETRGRPVAIGIDARTRGFLQEAILSAVGKRPAFLLFVTADEAVLQKRFTETRRRHPLAKDRPVSDGISREKELLDPLRTAANLVVDTSELSIHDLRRLLSGYFGLETGQKLTVTLMSFGFRYGLPREADIVMDVRFLKNPHWVPELKPLTGLDQPVGDYIKEDGHFVPFIERFEAMVEPLFPLYAKEGKSYLTVAIGCTGGHHRSVYTVETLARWLKDRKIETHVLHRDIER